MYKEWIKELKVGDEVFVRNAGGYRMTLHKVQSIISAPITGPIIVVDNVRYSSSGLELGVDLLSCRILEPATKEFISLQEREMFIKRVKTMIKYIDNISYQEAKQINEILNLGVIDTSEDKQ